MSDEPWEALESAFFAAGEATETAAESPELGTDDELLAPSPADRFRTALAHVRIVAARARTEGSHLARVGAAAALSHLQTLRTSRRARLVTAASALGLFVSAGLFAASGGSPSPSTKRPRAKPIPSLALAAAAPGGPVLALSSPAAPLSEAPHPTAATAPAEIAPTATETAPRRATEAPHPTTRQRPAARTKVTAVHGALRPSAGSPRKMALLPAKSVKVPPPARKGASTASQRKPAKAPTRR